MWEENTSAGNLGSKGPLPAFLITNSTEIALEDMAIESGPRSAVEVQNSRHVTVQRCLIQMRDRPRSGRQSFHEATMY